MRVTKPKQKIHEPGGSIQTLSVYQKAWIEFLGEKHDPVIAVS